MKSKGWIYFVVFLSMKMPLFSQQYLPDDLPGTYLQEIELNENEDWVLSEQVEQPLEVNDDELGIPGHLSSTEPSKAPPPITQKDKVSGPDGAVSFGKPGGYVEISNSTLLANVSKVGRYEWSFSLYKDDFDYKGTGTSFKRVFRADGKDTLETGRSDFPIALKVGFNHFLKRWNYLDIGLGLGTGIGYNSGKGVFSNGEISKTTFYLYTIPLDLGLSLQAHANSWLKVYATAGPSALGVLQYRTDLEERDDRKFLRQMSYGYFGEVHLGVGISKIFGGWGRSMLEEYDITKSYLFGMMRYQKYSNFKEVPLIVEGTSFGAGLSFEFF